jgi:hypothetical protein
MLTDDEETFSPAWSRFRESVSVIAWASFLAACIETMVFFAFFDPVMLGIDEAAPWMALRPIAYAAGFFLFWVFTFASSTLTAYMLGTSPNAPTKPTEPWR